MPSPIMHLSTRPALRTLLVLLTSGALAAFAGDKPKLADQPFFKHFAGDWKTEGELKAGADGNTVKFKQEWTGRLSGEGEFIMEGTRIINDGAPEKYRWNITYNPTTDLYEAVHLNPDDPANAIHFEGTLTQSPLALEMRAQLGNGGGSATVIETFKGDTHDTVECKVTFLSDSGGTNLEGILTHTRVKKP